MNISRRISLIQLLVFAIIGVVFFTIIGSIATGQASGGNITYGINGIMESRCVEGYRFVVDQNGNSRQILDEFGKGVRCENPNAGKPGAFGRM